MGARVYVCVADGAQDYLLRFFRERPSDVFRIKLADASWSWGGRNGRKGRKDVVAHAVAITRYTDDYYVIKNSWGEGFARSGYFNVAREALQLKCYDVFSERECEGVYTPVD